MTSKSNHSNVDDSIPELVQNANRFAFDLYAKLAATTEGNLVFSPSSITLALAMTFAGAAGQTAREMADVLRFSLTPGRLHEAFRLLQATTRTGGVEFRIANRLWGQQGYHFLSEFLATTERSYGAKFAEVDFLHAAEEARRQINSWVAEQTANKITNLIPPGILNDMTRLVLTNAIYFLGSWDSEFSESATKQAPFWATPEKSHDVLMMRQTGEFSYAEQDDCQILEMPYRQQQIEYRQSNTGEMEIVEIPSSGSDFAMCIVLPKSLDGLPEVEAQLSLNLIHRCEDLRSTRVEVHLPKFRIEAECMLNEVLSAMGMRQAFSRIEANFSQMSDNPEGLYIAAAIHKAFVDVNEKGTEAAAATAIVMRAGGMSREPDPALFRADHPFVFLIRDRQTGWIHFIGRVLCPVPAGAVDPPILHG